MKKLTEIVLKRPASVLVIVIGLIIFGARSIIGMNLQLIPDMDMPIQLIICTYPGAGPEDVEKLVTKPIEQGTSTISGVQETASYSLENMGLVMLSFDYGTDMDKAFIDIMQSLETVKARLPEDASDPRIISMDINATPSMYFSVEALNENLDPLAYVEETVVPELEKVSEIAETNVSGGQSEYISVELVPELLRQYNLNITSVANAVRDANFTVPAGTADYGGQTVNASSTAEYKTPEELRTIPVTTPTGDVIHLGEVANINYAKEELTSHSRYNGGEDVSLSITKTQQSSAVTLSRKVSKLIEKINEENPDYNLVTTYDASEAILDSLFTLAQTLLLGIVITMVILILFFGNFKGSLIVASSMPVSVLVTLILMSFMGFSLNLMTLGALVIAIGMMVDNSIVVIEMCFRKKADHLNFFDSALEGTGVVMTSIIASTITTVVVYLPMALVEGISGQLFGQLGFTIVFALLASLISAVTLVPLCFYIYKPIERQDYKVNLILEKVADVYGGILRKALKRKMVTALAAILIFAISIVLCRFINTELMPASDEGRVSITATFRPGTSEDIIDKKVLEIESFVSESPYVESYSSSTGGSSGMMSINSGTQGTVSATISKDSGMKTAEVVSEWTPLLMEYANSCTIEVASSSTGGMGALGNGGTYDVTLEGRNLDDLKSGALQVVEEVSRINGVIFVSSSLAEAASRADIVVDPLQAAASGLTPKMVAGTVYSMVQGTDVFDVNIDDKEYTVTVEYPRDTYGTINDINGITLMNQSGQDVPLSDVADIEFTDSPTTIVKNDGKYTATVTATIDPDNRYDIQKDIDKRVEEMSMPQGIDIAKNAMNQMMTEEFTALAEAIITAIILVYMVMAIQFNNLIYSALVMFCIPFSLIGSIVLLLLTRATLNMTSLMGFLMLIGIVVNNGIIFVDYTNMLRAEGIHIKKALIETGKSRLRPILMTSLTTILSMIPMGLGVGRNGQMTQGMAMVIIGGLTASTVLTLILLPTLYLIVARKKRKA